MPIGLIGGLASNLLGGIVGNIASAGSREEANQLAQQGYQELLKVGLPPDQARPLILQQFQSAGIYTPELEQAINQAHSAVAGIQEDQSTLDLQKQALQQLQQRAQGGLTAQDRLAMLNAQNQANQAAQQQAASVLQNAQARGQANGGAALLAQLQAGQDAANRQSEQGMQISAAAAQNALNALSQLGNQAGQVRGQSFDIAKAKAGAEEIMDQFNIQNQIAQQSRNVGAKNTAQQQNLSNAQQITNANVGLYNTEQQRQRAGEQQNFANAMQRAQALSNAAQGAAANKQAQAQQQAGMWQGLGSDVGAGFSSYQNRQDKIAAADKENETEKYKLMNKLLG